MKLSRAEQETIIRYDQEESTVVCFTSDPVLIRKLDKLYLESSEIQRTKQGDYFGEYVFPKKWLKVRMPRQLSDEKRSELSLRAKENFGHGK